MPPSHLTLRQRDQSAQGFPLSRLVDVLAELQLLSLEEHVVLRRVWGYGETVCKWDDETETGAHAVRFSEVFEVIHSDEQWFYDVDVEAPDGQFRFGVFDSSFAYFEGLDELVGSLEEYFSEGAVRSGALPF